MLRHRTFSCHGNVLNYDIFRNNIKLTFIISWSIYLALLSCFTELTYFDIFSIDITDILSYIMSHMELSFSYFISYIYIEISLYYITEKSVSVG